MILDRFINETSLPAVLVRMTACDCLSFQIFVTSSDLRKSLNAIDHSLPKSANEIKEKVVKYANHLRQRVARCLLTSKLKMKILLLLINEHLYKIRDTNAVRAHIDGLTLINNKGVTSLNTSVSLLKSITLENHEIC